MKKIVFGLTILMLTGLTACTPKYIKTMEKLKVAEPQTQTEIDQNIILDYLIANKIQAQQTESGIWYVLTESGESDKPNEKSKVKAHYTGTLLDSTKFDSSYDRGEPLDFALGQVIKGWQEAIKMLGKGGKGTFYIPSELAYGESGAGASIPANAVLKFDIELVDFEQILTREERAAKDEATIKAYLEANNINAQRLESGIWYVMTEEGTGKNPSVQANVTAHYSGTLLDGTKFDSSYDRGQPFTTTLDRVIVGWREAIPTLKKGGKGTFYIPSGLAYGDRAQGAIPSNSVLVFDIELVDFQESLNPVEQAAADRVLIMNYLKQNNITATETASGLWYVITEPGTGGHPSLTSKVKTHYKGTLFNGKTFDSSYDRGQPLEFGLNQVIRGWQEGIPLLQKGGKGTFYIPSGLAYGPKGAGGVIAPNSVLIFDVELLDFK